MRSPRPSLTTPPLLLDLAARFEAAASARPPALDVALRIPRIDLTASDVQIRALQR
jgi:hypothetical protein